jgi:SAM-dependent methyltransferase
MRVPWNMTERTLNSYLNLCTQVYDLSKPTPPADAFAFYRSYVSAAEGPILEPMCGTGRFLLPLIEEGFDVHGFDASSYMLQVLHEKAKARSIKPRVWQGFLEDLQRPDKYGLVLIPSGSFGLIVDSGRAKNALVKLHDHLRDNGVLVFEAETLQSAPAQAGIWRGSMWEKNDGKMIIANSLELPLQDDVSTSIWRYELVDGTHIIQTDIELIRVRHYDPIQLSLLLTEAGFKSTTMIRAFDRTDSPHQDDAVIVCECRK